MSKYIIKYPFVHYVILMLMLPLILKRPSAFVYVLSDISDILLNSLLLIILREEEERNLFLVMESTLHKIWTKIHWYKQSMIGTMVKIHFPFVLHFSFSQFAYRELPIFLTFQCGQILQHILLHFLYPCSDFSSFWETFLSSYHLQYIS